MNEKKLQFEVTEQEAGLLMNTLGELSYKNSYQLIHSLQDQFKKQAESEK